MGVLQKAARYTLSAANKNVAAYVLMTRLALQLSLSLVPAILRRRMKFQLKSTKKVPRLVFLNKSNSSSRGHFEAFEYLRTSIRHVILRCIDDSDGERSCCSV